MNSTYLYFFRRVISENKEELRVPTTEDKTYEEEDVTPTTSIAETRFWKLYPRPKNVLRRRATVSGASPTSTRPPVTFVQVSRKLFIYLA
jgi:hypothetical protein